VPNYGEQDLFDINNGRTSVYDITSLGSAGLKLIVVRQTFAKGAGWGTSYLFSNNENGTLSKPFSASKIETDQQISVTQEDGSEVYSNILIRTRSNLVTATIDLNGNITLNKAPSVFYSNIVVHAVYRIGSNEKCSDYKIEDVVTPQEVEITQDAVDVEYSGLVAETNVSDAIDALKTEIGNFSANHNSLSGLNDGEYQHLSTAEKESVVFIEETVDITTGAPDAGKVVKLNIDGMLDNSMLKTVLDVVNVIRVSATGGAQFTTPYDAIESAKLLATASNPYCIVIEPGVYVCPTLTLTPGIHVIGRSQEATILESDGSGNLFECETTTSISFLTIRNVATGYVAVNMVNIGSFVVFHKVTFVDVATAIKVSCDSSVSYAGVYLEYCDTTQDDTTSVGFDFYCEAGGYLYVSVQDTYVYGSDTAGTNLPIGFKLSGSGIDATLNTCSCIGYAIDTSSVGIQIDDGAKVKLLNVEVEVFNTALYNPASSPVNIMANGIAIVNCNNDIVIDQHNTNAIINGTLDLNKCSVEITNITVSILANNPTIGSFSTSFVGDVYSGNKVSALAEVTSLWTESSTMGLLKGGLLTKDPTPGNELRILVQAGFGYVKSNDDLRLIKLEWDNTFIDLSGPDNQWIYFNNSGTLLPSLNRPDNETNIVLGRVLTSPTEIYIILQIPTLSHHTANKLSEFARDVFGPIFEVGGTVGENATPNKLDVLSGEYYFGENKFKFDDAFAITFDDLYHTAGFPDFVATDIVDDTQYDNGTNLVALTPGYYTKHSLYINYDKVESKFLLVHGTANADTIDAVRLLPSPAKQNWFVNSIAHLADIIVKDSNGIIEISDQRPIPSFVSDVEASVITSHSSLSNLGADDHTQYLLVDGSRAMTNDLDMNNNSLDNVLDINGVDISAHGSRHGSAGADAIPAGIVSDITALGNTASAGTSNAFALADHKHTHGNVSGAGATTMHIPSQVGMVSPAIVVATSPSVTVNSTSFTFVNGMTITPGVAGTYAITFSSNGNCNIASTEGEYTICKNGTPIASSTRKFRSVNQTTLYTQIVDTSNGTDIYTVQMRVSSANGSVTIPGNRSLLSMGI
jgi:hypothetical protein